MLSAYMQCVLRVGQLEKRKEGQVSRVAEVPALWRHVST